MATFGSSPSEHSGVSSLDRGSDADEYDESVALDRRRGTLTSKPMEHAFRVASAKTYRRQVSLGLAAVSIPMLGFAYTDYFLFGLGAAFWGLLALRLATVAGAALVVHIAKTASDPRVADRALMVWWVAEAMSVCVIDASRPPTYLLHIAIDVLFVMTAYALPNRWANQVFAGVVSTLGPVAIFATLKPGLVPMQIALVAIAFLYANTLGAVLSHHLNIASRTQFLSHARELEARARLREFTRMIPMCSSCKSIRDPAGEWHRVEEFVHAETGSDITHGLCPSCVSELYPQFGARKKS